MHYGFTRSTLFLTVLFFLGPTNTAAQWTTCQQIVINDPGSGSGVAWGDYDNDGDLDIYLSNVGSANRLFRNNGNCDYDIVAIPALEDAGAGHGVAWADYNNDGFLDLYLANANQPNKLFRNDGNDTFSDVTNVALADSGNARSVAWADYDGDGDLDLYLTNFGGANKLFRNEGGDTFVDSTSGLLGDAGLGAGAAWGDYDNDGDPDLYLANWGSANKLLQNNAGVFVDVTNGPLGDTGSSAGAAWGDYDNDRDLDLYITNFGQSNKLFRNDGGGTFTDVTAGPLADTGLGQGVAWGDYDNDGDLDLYFVNLSQANVLLRNDGGTFVDATVSPLDDAGPGQGVAWGDHDDDGDIDLYLAQLPGGNKLFRNEVVTSNHWLHLSLVGIESNYSAVGARVRVVAGGASQIREISSGSGYLSQNSLTAEFGLGATTTVDTVEISWPGGLVEQLTNISSVDQAYTLVEGDEWTVLTSIPPSSHQGAAWGDYDDDGDHDLCLFGQDSPRLFRNDGGTFVDVTSGPFIVLTSGGAAWADHDNDGDLDMYLTAPQSSVSLLARNDGNDVFTNVAAGDIADVGSGRGVAWADYDNDGDVDFYRVAFNLENKLFRNDGNDVFVDTAAPIGGLGNANASVWADYDNDGDVDLFVAHPSSSRLYRNDNGIFVDVTTVPLAMRATFAAWGDYDNDGDLDLYVPSVALWGPNKLFENNGAGGFTDVTSGPLENNENTHGAIWGDYDLDGHLDLYVTAGTFGQESELYRNKGGGVFVNATASGLDSRGTTSIAWVDFDNDGDLDVWNNELVRNDRVTTNHWLQVKLVGSVSNRAGIGARIRVVTGGASQIREVSGGSGFSQGPLVPTFGLGTSTIADLVEVRWPSGIVDVATDVAVDQILTLTESMATAINGTTLPKTYALHQNIPNPFNPNTRIVYEIPTETSFVTLHIYDVRGRLVRTLVDGPQTLGVKNVAWNGRDDRGERMATGVYFYRLVARGFQATRKMVLLQ